MRCLDELLNPEAISLEVILSLSGDARMRKRSDEGKKREERERGTAD